MQAVCFCTYLTEIGSGWRSADYDAHDFIHAIKDREINGYAYVLVAGKRLRFDNANRQDVVGWFAKMVADYFAAQKLATNVVLVSVPGSKNDLKCAGTPRTTVLASAIATTLKNATVRDVLRWKAAMPSANAQGGTRDPNVLFKNLAITGSVGGANVVLVDDVLTSGGHAQACAALVRQKGGKVLRMLCAGRADDTQVDDPFAVRVEEVADFEP